MVNTDKIITTDDVLNKFRVVYVDNSKAGIEFMIDGLIIIHLYDDDGTIHIFKNYEDTMEFLMFREMDELLSDMRNRYNKTELGYFAYRLDESL